MKNIIYLNKKYFCRVEKKKKIIFITNKTYLKKN